MKKYLVMIFAVVSFCLFPQQKEHGQSTDLFGVFTIDNELYVGKPDEAEPVRITQEWPDFKPSWSPDGEWIVFFRIVNSPKLNIPEWKTKICVIRPNGTDLRDITDGTHNDLNPTWTRDGSNNIIINRCDFGKSHIYFSTPHSKPGDEKLISNPDFMEFAHCGMKDGRIIIMTTNGVDKSYFESTGEKGLFSPPYVRLLTPDPGKIGKYEFLKFDEKIMMLPNRISLSPDEKKIVFERDDSFDPLGFAGHPLVIADFNKDEPCVSEMKIFYDTPFYEYALYPAWTTDSKGIIYFGSFAPLKMKLYLYNFETHEISSISPEKFKAFKYFCGYKSPK